MYRFGFVDYVLMTNMIKLYYVLLIRFEFLEKIIFIFVIVFGWEIYISLGEYLRTEVDVQWIRELALRK